MANKVLQIDYDTERDRLTWDGWEIHCGQSLEVLLPDRLGGGKLLLKTSVIYSVILWMIIMIFPQIFAGMFTSDSTLLAFTKTALRIYMAVVFIFGVQIACQMTFISLGRAKDSIIVAIVRKFVLVIPLVYILPHIFRGNQTNAVYMAEPVADILAVAFTAILFFFEFRKALTEMSGSQNS